MQPGSIGGSPYNVKASYSYKTTVQAAPPQVSEEPIVETKLPEERVTLAARFKVSADALQAEDQGNGQTRSAMTIALVPQKDQIALEKQGVIFPEIEEVRSNQGLSPDGRLELVPVDGTGNPETTHILQTLEVKRSLLEKDASGRAPIDDYSTKLLEPGQQIIAKGWFGVPEGTVVAPMGYEFKMGSSASGAKTEAKRIRLNRISDATGNFAQSSLAGIMKLPYVSAAAPFVAMATAGATANHYYSELKNAQDLLGYVDQREGIAKGDKVTLELGVGTSIPVSAKAERKRLEAKVRQAQGKLLSTSLGFASGGASVLGFAAAGGAFGTGAAAAALTGAVAATPYLAGAAMAVGVGGMVLGSLAELKSLSKEKAELTAMLAKGETHSTKTIERTDPQLKRPVAVGEQSVPITEQIKQIEKEQRKHRLMATGLTGAMSSVVGTVATGISAMTLTPLVLAPAGVLVAGQSIGRLRELSKEKKELVELHKTGAEMAPRQIERQDGSWNEEKIPISTLLSQIEKKQKTHKLILTAVGSAGAVMGVTLGAGMTFLAAAPILLIPAIIGAALFPEKVKEFADKVSGFVAGKFGEAGRSRKELVTQAESETAALKQQMIADLDPLAAAHPDLFYTPTKQDYKIAKQTGTAPQMGYFTQLSMAMDAYAASGSRAGRVATMQQIETLLASAPPAAQGAPMEKIRGQLSELHMNTEAGWVARDVALEMKQDSTEKVLDDDRVKARVSELGFGTDDLEQQFESSLYLENSETRTAELLQKSRAGDRDASLELARKEVFGAGRLYYKSQEELGSYLFADLVDAIAQPENGDNLERVIKEVNYQLGRPMAPSTGEQPGDQWWLGESTLGLATGYNEPLRLADFQPLANALSTLEKPLDIAAAGQPSTQTATALDGPQARMANAFRGLHEVDAKATDRLGQAFATLNDPTVFEGLSAEQAQLKRSEAGLELTKAKQDLEAKAPELMSLWEKARVDVQEDYFQRSIDTEFTGQVLARPEIAEAAGRLNVTPESVKSLYMSLLRSEVTGDSRALQGQLVDASGKEIDPAKAELLEVIDRTIATVVSQQSAGGNDTVATTARLGQPDADPQVAAFLEANPTVGQVLESESFAALAAELHAQPEEVRQAYLTLVQANLHPAMTAEFDGLYAGGDINAVKTFQIGSRVGQLVQAATRPTAEQVAQQVEAGMQGPIVAAVLGQPELKALGESLKVDAPALMRTLLAADLSGDGSAVADLTSKARNGDTHAAAQLQMLQSLAQSLLQATSEIGAPPQQPLAQAA